MPAFGTLSPETELGGGIVPPESTGLTNKFGVGHPLTQGIADLLRRYVGYYQTPGSLLDRSLVRQPETAGQWSEADEQAARGNADEVGRRGRVMALDAITGGLPFAKQGAVGMAGGRPGAAAKAEAPKPLPMDEASRMARADELGFRRDRPFEFGRAPQGEGVQAAAINMNDKVFTGPSHFDAIMRAEKELSLPFDQMRHGPIVDGFVTTSGRYVSRREAADIAKRASQGESNSIFGATRGAASEDLKMMPAKSAADSKVNTGATAPGLDGGNGIWGWMGRQHGDGAGPPKNSLLPRFDRIGRFDAHGVPEHNLQATLRGAWDDGLNAVILQNYTSPGGKKGEVLVVKDPSQLRSPTAAFDPAKKNSADLLAGIAGATAAAPIFGSLAPSPE